LFLLAYSSFENVHLTSKTVRLEFGFENAKLYQLFTTIFIKLENCTDYISR